jgi:outer membrane cobalamin receptor
MRQAPVMALVFLATSLTPGEARGQARYHESVVVTASAAPSEIGEVGRAVSVVDRSAIEQFAVHSIADLLRLVPHLQIHARGERGVQTDFSLRGATFGQTLVLVDGVRINDSQTGHHNGDIPVPLDEIERIEVLYGPSSSLHGADAFGGTINVLTRRAASPTSLRLAGGSFGFVDGAASTRFGRRETKVGLTLAGSRSDGFTAQRDFRVLEGRAWASLGVKTRLSLSHLDKEFGARGFYGPAPSREWTSQTLASLERSFTLGNQAAGAAQAYLRLHDDRFVYDVDRPVLSDNRHDSGAAGLSLKLHRRIGEHSRLSVGSEVGADWIDSSNLGSGGYGRLALFGELQQRLGGITVTPGVRATAHEGFERDVSPSLALAGPLGESLRWRASVAHAFRVPTFTERRYRDPNHEAHDRLAPESAWGADVGFDLGTRGGWGGSCSVFGRWDASVIDWVRPDPNVRWRTTNIRDVRTVGVEIAVRPPLGANADLSLFYGYLGSATNDLALLSKYLLDFVRHSAGARLRLAIPGDLQIGLDASYRRHADGRDGVLLDSRLSRRLGRFVAFLDVTNLLATRTQEIRGVAVPGRAFSAGLRVRLP